MTAITLTLEPLIELTHEQFYELCMANKDVAMERSPEGALIIIPPVGGGSGKQEADYIIDLGIWNRQTSLGVVQLVSGFYMVDLQYWSLNLI